MPDATTSGFSADVVLRDGSTVRLRLIAPQDAEAMVGLFGLLPRSARTSSFFAGGAPDRAHARRVANPARDAEATLVAEQRGRLWAAARYVRSASEPERADLGLIMAEHFQGRGVSTRLIEELAGLARAAGVRTFDVHVPHRHPEALEVVLQAGFDAHYARGASGFQVELSLTPTAGFERRHAARAHTAAAAALRSFFEPRVVAVVGANRERGRIGSEILHNLTSGGFTGSIVPVHPHVANLAGLDAYPRVDAIPGSVDLAIVAVPAAQVDEVLDDCIEKGVPAVVVISAGFGETGPEGRRREQALLEKIRGAGMRLIGPNCMGLINTDPAIRLNATFSPTAPPEGSVSLLSQSGALGLAILDYARRLNIGISTFVSVGNKADISGNDLLEYWSQDARTTVVLLYLESFGNPVTFARLAREIGRRKPIVAVKAGRSEAGARAASSHTGALASTDRVVDALLRQTGVIRVDTLAELFDVAALLAHQPVPRGPRVGILTNAGGPAILAADACEARGLEVPPLGEATVDALRRFLPTAAATSNPVDMLASAPPEAFSHAIHAMLDDDAIDSLLVIFIPPLVTEPEAVAAAIVEAAGRHRAKPVLTIFMSAAGTPDVLRPIPCYEFPEAAAIALARVARYGRWLGAPAGVVPELSGFDAEGLRAAVDTVLSRGAGWLQPVECQRVLAAAGIPMVATRMASTLPDAIEAAEAIGYPVALKAVGPRIVHKTEVGGVHLGVDGPVARERAYAQLAMRLKAELTGVIVQQMAPRGVEVVIGATRDPQFGPVIACGTGGILVELLDDVALRIHPLTDRDAEEMLQEVRGMALLRGYRGAAPADEGAVKEALLRVSRLVTECPELLELDVNPLVVRERGVIAVDARIRLGTLPPARPGRWLI